ncbi:MAG TPA: tRNA 2-thiouridine(34) synthase MnmA, partial [Planctomycetes bacterium]|nr:tRNA 2-thiouridine(34) synthase MnmA [Planctomycetota bacterium]
RELFGKIRSSGKAAPCIVDETDSSGMKVIFREPQFAPAPGQHLVLYDGGGRVVAGGVIRP